MTPPPARPKIYHITHIDNLPSILASGGLDSDATMIARGGPVSSIGMGTIKQRRLSLPVKCFPQDNVGQYVPFYFGPRSIMLYLLHRGNHAGVTHRGRQEPIIHLEADFSKAVDWADSDGRRWAFTLSNAGATYTEFRCDTQHLNEINWDAVGARDFRDSSIKEGKQAEFLVRDFFPFAAVERIGVQSPVVHSRVVRALAESSHHPAVEVLPNRYY